MNNNKIYGVIYRITNKVNGKVYVGQTRQDPVKRFRDHVFRCKGNRHLNSAVKKYGEENFTFRILCEVHCAEQDFLDLAEVYFIEYYDSLNKLKGYNMRAGGRNITSSRPSHTGYFSKIDKAKLQKLSQESIVVRKLKKEKRLQDFKKVVDSISIEVLLRWKTTMSWEKLCKHLQQKYGATMGLTLMYAELRKYIKDAPKCGYSGRERKNTCAKAPNTTAYSQGSDFKTSLKLFCRIYGISYTVWFKKLLTTQQKKSTLKTAERRIGCARTPDKRRLV